jgi:8-oxo-dGTP pyrophosphatase MutT (NUDIX family)
VISAAICGLTSASPRNCTRFCNPTTFIKGLKPPKSAAREAYEEAGIRGTVGAKAIGFFSYEKGLDANGVTVPCEVRVFPMIVKRQHDVWPEAHEREARWFEPGKVLSAIKDEGLRELIDLFVERITARKFPR